VPGKRKPAEVRELHGSRPRPPNPELPDLSNSPDAPEWLPDAAKEEWKRLIEVCRRYDGWLQQVDRAALSAYCMSWATYEQAARDVAERGVLVPGRSSADEAAGALVKNSALQIARDASISMLRWCKELGFTPDSRGRIDIHRLASFSGGRQAGGGVERFFSGLSGEE
jgi:P27 family predicted phage terminase small subunit